MGYEVDFENVSTVGLESSPVAAALAGLRAHEARYFSTKYGHAFVVEPAYEAKEIIDWVHRILEEERDLVIASRPLEATELRVENIRCAAHSRSYENPSAPPIRDRRAYLMGWPPPGFSTNSAPLRRQRRRHPPVLDMLLANSALTRPIHTTAPPTGCRHLPNGQMRTNASSNELSIREGRLAPASDSIIAEMLPRETNEQLQPTPASQPPPGRPPL